MAATYAGPTFLDQTGMGVFSFNFEFKPMTPINPNDHYQRATIRIRHWDFSGSPDRVNCHSTDVYLAILDDFLRPAIPPIIEHIVSPLRVDRRIRSNLCHYMMSKLRRIATYPIRSCDVIFNVDFSTSLTAAIDDTEETLNQLLGESMDVALSNSHGVPASTSAIEALKKKKFVARESREVKCVICQDEFSESETVLEMPCSHIFHGQCILQWLNQSHYCPLYRFEMPKQERND